jgi:Uma2 family endonuclease
VTIAEHNLADQDFNADLPLHPGRRMTEEEFVEWSSDFWAEWIDGEIIMMMAVNRDHASLQDFLYRLLGMFVEERGLGRTFAEPYQIRLHPQRRRRAPDIMFVSKDRSDIIKKNHIEGGPDLIIEIVSPESESRDWRDKYLEYESAGVREYWVVNPTSGRTEAYTLSQDGKYSPTPELNGKISSTVLPGFHIRPAWILAQPLPRVRDALADMGM